MLVTACSGREHERTAGAGAIEHARLDVHVQRREPFVDTLICCVVWKSSFLYACASSTYSMSTPRSSNGITLSFADRQDAVEALLFASICCSSLRRTRESLFWQCGGSSSSRSRESRPNRLDVLLLHADPLEGALRDDDGRVVGSAAAAVNSLPALGAEVLGRPRP